MTNTKLRTKIFQIIWFLSFGLFASAMVLIARPFAEVLGIFAAYLLGGLAAFAITLPIGEKNEPGNSTRRQT